MERALRQGRKSSHSNPDGNCVEVSVYEYVGGRKSKHSRNAWDCVEVGTFRKSAKCQKDCCVSVGTGPGVVGIRDTKLEDKSTGTYRGATLEIPAAQFAAFLVRVRDGIDRA